MPAMLLSQNVQSYICTFKCFRGPNVAKGVQARGILNRGKCNDKKRVLTFKKKLWISLTIQ